MPHLLLSLPFERLNTRLDDLSRDLMRARDHGSPPSNAQRDATSRIASKARPAAMRTLEAAIAKEVRKLTGSQALRITIEWTAGSGLSDRRGRVAARLLGVSRDAKLPLACGDDVDGKQIAELASVIMDESLGMPKLRDYVARHMDVGLEGSTVMEAQFTGD